MYPFWECMLHGWRIGLDVIVSGGGGLRFGWLWVVFGQLQVHLMAAATEALARAL
jgi:hypothetical protein